MLFAATVLLGLAAAPPQGPSVKELFDRQLSQLRETQQSDGSYGSRLDTAYMVVALTLCPRAYREDDGPFISHAVRWLLQYKPAFEDPGGDAVTALALLCADGERYRPTLTRLAEGAGLSVSVLQTLAAGGQAALPDGLSTQVLRELPLPKAGQSAKAILEALGPEAGIAVRLAAVATAGIAYRAQSKPSGEKIDGRQVYERGIDYLLSQKGKSGLWEVYGKPEPGISALCARALLGSQRQAVQQQAIPVLDFLRGLQKDSGAIYDGHLPVYVTSVAVMALAAGGREQDQEAIAKAAQYLATVQTDEGEGYSEADKFYGGIGYGNDLRPDLSNLQYAMQALKDAGREADDPAFQRALVFLQRVQNRSESNPEVFQDADKERPVRAGNDGGAVYYPGNSPAGTILLADGSSVARSYGSMTYALLKCYVFAGLERSDPRVQAAVDWIQRHWTLEVNPGFDTLRDPRAGFQGLYYYYLSLAEALDAAGVERIQVPHGESHDWRLELLAKLAAEQQQDGSWVNQEASRWWEGNPVLCTAYALAALQVAGR
ncbi:MAG: hypothetical protein DWQ01_02550 [Planctomycetota bacterium]|nr:MAG: hypothetical protein DWQ01_02550 [Planctomycetota bacterium]